MKSAKILIALSFMLFTAAASQAQNAQTPDKVKIANGVKSGELTNHETRKIVKQERNIRQDKRAARADGVVTPQERREIKVDKRKADASIYRKKHNNRVRN